LMAAVTNGDSAVVNALVAAGADVNAADAGGGPVLRYAAAAGSADALRALQQRGAKAVDIDLRLAATECHTDAVRVLLDGGLEPDGAAGDAPLLVAVVGGCVDVVRLLLDRKANINVKDQDGMTALIKAAAANMPEIVGVLLERGADMDVEDRLGRTAELYSTMNGREAVAELLKQARAKKK
jgi:uncharacterized protein